MNQLLATNQAFGQLSLAVGTGDTSITLQTGQSSRFPTIAADSGDWFYICMVDTSNNVEYCLVTATAGDTFTVSRGQDGSNPLAFAASTRVELRINAGTIKDLQTMIQQVQTNLSNAVEVLLAELNGGMVGIIAMYENVSSGSIPAGWHLCDGTGGTPDLRDKFVVGAGNTYAVAAGGGSATATLTADNVPPHLHSITDKTHNHTINQSAHAHSVADSGHAHSVYDPGHVHHAYDGGNFVVMSGNDANFNNQVQGSPSNAAYNNYTGTSATGIGIYAAATGIGIYATTISISNNAVATGITSTNNSTGSSAPVATLPPYYALAYVKRTGTWT